MEARISDRFRALSALRHALVEKIQQSIKSPYVNALINHPSVVHIVLVSTTLTVITSIYAHARSVTLFTFHPVFMTIGSILLIGEGKLFRLFEIFSLILRYYLYVIVHMP
jgi:hypothetical protein